MIHDRLEDAGKPKPEWLAAYVDGELSPDQRALVETWLAGHPECAAEVKAHERLRRLCQTSTPPEPDQTQWEAVLGQVERRLAIKPVSATPRRRLAWLLTGLTAASLLLAVTLLVPAVPDRMAGWFVTSNDSFESVEGPPEIPLIVASADDIEIISMDDGDREALIVGEPPVRETLELLKAGEVEDVQFGDGMDGMNPQYFQGNGTAPMLIIDPSPAPSPETKDP
jgi:hypothetical protein